MAIFSIDITEKKLAFDKITKFFKQKYGQNQGPIALIAISLHLKCFETLADKILSR